MTVDAGTLANIASVIAAFGAAMLFFRIQRELQMRGKGEPVWLPWADWLLVAATLICLLLVIVPIVSTSSLNLPAAASASAAILVAGYVFAILAHYRIVFGRNRDGPRSNPEPAELLFVIVATVAAVGVFMWRLSR
jgi:glucan phosphoethanolaminetransferase (alkaline phosphatase superfamily)